MKKVCFRAPASERVSVSQPLISGIGVDSSMGVRTEDLGANTI